MKPLHAQPPFALPIREPQTGLLTIVWVKWIQSFFFVDPLFTVVTSIAVAASPYTALSTDEVIIADTSGGAITVKLPASLGDIWLSKTRQSKQYTIKASGASAVTVNGNGQNIDGAATANIAANTSKSFINDGTQWYAVD